MTGSVPLYVVTGVVTASLAWEAVHRERLSASWAVVRQIRPWMLAANLPVLAVTMGLGGLLYTQVPWLQWGWLSALTGDTHGTNGGNANVVGLGMPWWFSVPFGLLLLAVIPWLAAIEEFVFRHGTQGWRDGWWRSLLFGAVHLVAGVPIAAALALTVPGLWFTWHYLRGDVRRSAAVHASWNYTVFVGLVGSLMFGGQ